MGMNMKKRNSAALLSLLAMTSCGTIVNGTCQKVPLDSNPQGAKVFVDQRFRGCTPMTAKLSRSNNHSVRLEMDGYEPYEIHFERHMSGWVLGNIVFGGVVGLAVDAVSGGLYKLTPDQTHVEFSKPSLAKLQTEDGLFVTVVEKPSKDWELVGSVSQHIS